MSQQHRKTIKRSRRRAYVRRRKARAKAGPTKK